MAASSVFPALNFMSALITYQPFAIRTLETSTRWRDGLGSTASMVRELRGFPAQARNLSVVGLATRTLIETPAGEVCARAVSC